jgi:hypothetical protein
LVNPFAFAALGGFLGLLFGFGLIVFPGVAVGQWGLSVGVTVFLRLGLALVALFILVAFWNARAKYARLALPARQLAGKYTAGIVGFAGGLVVGFLVLPVVLA